MSLSEASCYTIINAQETEPYNEMQLKLDLGKFTNFSFSRSLTILTEQHLTDNVFCQVQQQH